MEDELVESGFALFKVWHMPGWTKKNHKQP